MRAYEDPTQPGRVDVNGIEWWACDPYPRWYRWEKREDGSRVLRCPAEQGQRLPIFRDDS